MSYYLIHDPNCPTCGPFIQLLQSYDRGQLFTCISLENQERLAEFGLTLEECKQKGLILINTNNLSQRWYGSEAIEEVVNVLPMGQLLIATYRAMPGAKPIGDRVYVTLKDTGIC
ncbi:MAG: DCC1-like thiol-disulfide oxidoreductase family protein [Cyanobacteriota bacterium]|nr:DCC1-like thiol-disulfide oxidoreductase family protein [Cyanobacteriota bacterium]